MVDYSKWDRIELDDEEESATSASSVGEKTKDCCDEADGRSVCHLAAREYGVSCSTNSGHAKAQSNELNEMQARDWMFRSGVDGPSTWLGLWSMIGIPRREGEDESEEVWLREGPSECAMVACPPCRCGREAACHGLVSAGLVAHDAVTCWRCKNFFDGRCVPGLEEALCSTAMVSFVDDGDDKVLRHVAVELEGVYAHVERHAARAVLALKQAAKLAAKIPTAKVWRTRGINEAEARRDVGLLCAWGRCPSCCAELGASCLPKHAIVHVGRKVYQASEVDEADRMVLRRVFAVEAGYCLRQANEVLLWARPLREAIETCTRALNAINTARSLDPDLFRYDLVDLYFRAHYTRSCLERTGNNSAAVQFRCNARHETCVEAEHTLLQRSQVIGRSITPGVLEGVPPQFVVDLEGAPPSPEWWPSKDAKFEDLFDSEARVARVWRACKDKSLPGLDTPALAVVALAFDARWLLRSEHAAQSYWHHCMLQDRTHEHDDSDPFRCSRLDYAQNGFALALEEPGGEDNGRPVALPGANDSRVFRSRAIINGLVAFNCLFRLGRICAKLFVLVELRQEDVVDPAITLAVLGLASTALANVRAILEDPKANPLLNDLPDTLIPQHELM